MELEFEAVVNCLRLVLVTTLEAAAWAQKEVLCHCVGQRVTEVDNWERETAVPVLQTDCILGSEVFSTREVELCDRAWIGDRAQGHGLRRDVNGTLTR